MSFMINSLTQSIVNGVGTGSAFEVLLLAMLLILLIQKLFSAAINSRFGHALHRSLNAPLAIFLLAFVLVAAVRVAEILNQ